jgi:hypothetical protein
MEPVRFVGLPEAAGGDNAVITTAKAVRASRRRRQFVRDRSRRRFFMLFILDNRMATHGNLSTGSKTE